MNSPMAHPSAVRTHILYVDDEEALVEIGQRRIEHLGYDVTTHTCSVKALADFQSNPNRYSALITDLSMPVLNGLELARKVIAIRPEMPIILCTGDRSAFNDEQIDACGVSEVILKPVSAGALTDLLATILE